MIRGDFAFPPVDRLMSLHIFNGAHFKGDNRFLGYFFKVIYLDESRTRYLESFIFRSYNHRYYKVFREDFVAPRHLSRSLPDPLLILPFKEVP